MLGLQLEDSRILREAKAQGEREKALAIALRLLTHKLGTLDESLRARVQELSSAELEDLSEAVLDFEGLEDLLGWLEGHSPQG